MATRTSKGQEVQKCGEGRRQDQRLIWLGKGSLPPCAVRRSWPAPVSFGAAIEATQNVGKR